MHEKYKTVDRPLSVKHCWIMLSHSTPNSRPGKAGRQAGRQAAVDCKKKKSHGENMNR